MDYNWRLKMSNQKVFILSSEGVPAQYGIGRYIDILEIEATKSVKRKFVFVSRSEKYQSFHSYDIDNILKIEIPYPKKGRKLTKFSALGILSMLDNTIGICESDIFHFNESEHHSLVEVIKDYYGCRVIYTIHFSLWSFFYNNNYDKFLKAWETRNEEMISNEISTIIAEQSMCKLSDAIISLNMGTHRFLEEIYGIEKQKIRKIENGVNIYPEQMSNKDKDVFRYDLGLDEDDKIILYVGRVDEEKGIKFLIQSFLAIKPTHNYKLIIVGHGDINGMLPLIYNNWRNIIFTGYVPAMMVNNFYNIANLVVLPSLSEQGSYSVLEAISHKKPILVSDIPAFEYLSSGEMAIKVKLSADGSKIEDNALQMEIEKFIFGEYEYTKMTDKSYDFICEHFSSKKMFAALQAVYYLQ